MSGLKPRTNSRISAFLNAGARERVAASTRREMPCCGSRCWSATKARPAGAGLVVHARDFEHGRESRHVARDALRVERRREHGDDARLRIEREYRGRVIHGVVAAGEIDARRGHAEALGGLRQFRARCR